MLGQPTSRCVAACAFWLRISSATAQSSISSKYLRRFLSNAQLHSCLAQSSRQRRRLAKWRNDFTCVHCLYISNYTRLLGGFPFQHTLEWLREDRVQPRRKHVCWTNITSEPVSQKLLFHSPLSHLEHRESEPVDPGIFEIHIAEHEESVICVLLAV